MLNQLIYTRCIACRDLKNRGQVARKDGFGVFSMSRELITNPPVSSFEFLQARLAAPNGAKEGSADVGLFNSYEYTALASDLYALSFEVARPHCKEPRKNGKGHRTGTYIKQCFVGRPDDYPFMWFGASAWNAHLKSENYYYLDDDPNAEPEWLSMVPDAPNGSYITIDKVKQFVNEGRSEAVKAGIWFLIQEYSKPEHERKVLLIKDVPENVELWVAAIGYAFSVDLAKTITFSTNKTRLGTQTESILFYYTDEAGRFYPMRNHSVAQTKHPYNMIVGYHPKDVFCSAVKQMPTSNFVLIDGTTKTAGFAADDSIHSAYYLAAVQYDADIMDFVSAVLPSLPLKSITNRIPELYDAYKYLLDSNHRIEKWTYRDAVLKLKAILQYGVPNNDALNSYILNEGLRGYQRFVAEDERNGFQFLKILWSIGKLTKCTQDVTSCIADRLSAEMMNLRVSGNALTVTWNAIKSGSVQGIVQPVLQDMFIDHNLADYRRQFYHASASAIGTLLDMYYYTLSIGRSGTKAIIESNERYQFICSGLTALIDDGNALRVALNGIIHSDDVVNAVALSVSQFLDEHNPSKTERWWNAIIEVSGGNVINLCSTLCKSSTTSIDMIEHLLANDVLRSGRCDREHYRAFDDSVKQLGKKKNTGIVFFSTCIEVENQSHLDSLIRSIRGSKLSPHAEKELFRRVDNAVPYDSFSGISSNTFREMKEWATETGETSMGIALYDLRKNMEHERKPEKVLELMHDFSNRKLALPNGFVNGRNFATLSQVAAYFCDAEVHMTFLNLFDIQDVRTKQEYTKRYVEEVLSGAKGKQLVYSMITLCEAFYYEFKIPGIKVAQVKDSASMLKSCFVEALPSHYKSNLADQVSKADYGEPSVKNMLISLIQDASQEAPKGSLSDLLSGLFGRRKK